MYVILKVRIGDIKRKITFPYLGKDTTFLHHKLNSNSLQQILHHFLNYLFPNKKKHTHMFWINLTYIWTDCAIFLLSTTVVTLDWEMCAVKIKENVLNRITNTWEQVRHINYESKPIIWYLKRQMWIFAVLSALMHRMLKK